MQLNENYIPTLNGWRAIAVLLVIAAHSYTMLQNSETKIGAVAAEIFSHAGVGVDVFFAISGFLICTLLLQEKAGTGEINLVGFYTRRAFRIMPIMYLYLIVVLLLKISNIIPDIEFSEILASALFVRNYFQGTSWYTGHLWSLAIEEHFYLFVPLVLATLSWRSALRFCCAVVLACAAIRLLEYTWLPVLKVEFRTESRIDAIMYGAIGALLVHRFRPILENRLTGLLTTAAMIGAVILCFVFPEMPVRRTVMAVVMPLPIIFTVLHPKTLLGSMLEWHPIQWIGKISYSLYIWQMIFLVPYDRPMPVLQSFPLAFVLTFACAVASYFLVERPFIQLGHTLANRHRGIPPEEVLSRGLGL